MDETSTAFTRCEWVVDRPADAPPGARVRIVTCWGDWYVDGDLYDTLSDEDFTGLVLAFEADDHQAVEEKLAVARVRVPGLVSLAVANDAHLRAKALELAARVWGGLAGVHGQVTDDQMVTTARRFADYLRNG